MRNVVCSISSKLVGSVGDFVGSVSDSTAASVPDRVTKEVEGKVKKAVATESSTKTAQKCRILPTWVLYKEMY